VGVGLDHEVTLTGVLPVLMKEAAHTARGRLEGLIDGCSKWRGYSLNRGAISSRDWAASNLPTPKTGG